MHSPVVEIRYLPGAEMARLDPRKPRSPHGFYCIENEVISTIADFIRAHWYPVRWTAYPQSLRPGAKDDRGDSWCPLRRVYMRENMLCLPAKEARCHSRKLHLLASCLLPLTASKILCESAF